jgi:hypothetical protein
MFFTYFCQNPYSGTWTRTQEPLCTDFVYIGPVLGNLDPYLGTSSTCLCTKVPEYGTHIKNTPYLGVFFTINVLILISTVTIDAWLFCHVPWVIGFESGLKKINFT